MIVVDLRGRLAGVGAQNPPGPLHDAAFVSDRRGEKQGVQDRAVEAFPDVRPGGDDHQRRATRPGLEPRERGGTGLGAHPAGIVSHKVAVDGRDPAWRRGVGVSCVAEAGRMHAQDKIEVVGGRLCLSIQR
ncbi:MAG TPA: hypothetical protein VMV17_05140 [Streptosporangiaceae bacterium]|nr:hypothetical protein [Streptosporangiaceae bacterium]